MMSTWQIVLVAAASLVAVSSLVRLMRQARRRHLEQWLREIEARRPRKRKKKAVPENGRKAA